jgi:hypothetical protein
MAGRPLHCIEFSMLGPATEPNPLVIPLRDGDVSFEVFDHAGSPWPNAEIHDRFRAMGLDCGHRVEINLKLSRVTTVALKLIQWAQPATVEALAGGQVVDSATMDSDQGVPQLITLGGGRRSRIEQVVITAPANETALLELCVG